MGHLPEGASQRAPQRCLGLGHRARQMLRLASTLQTRPWWLALTLWFCSTVPIEPHLEESLEVMERKIPGPKRCTQDLPGLLDPRGFVPGRFGLRSLRLAHFLVSRRQYALNGSIRSTGGGSTGPFWSPGAFSRASASRGSTWPPARVS